MRPYARILCLALTSGAMLITGCGIGTMAPGGASISEAASISGIVHGGQQPVYNAVVRLYSAGTGGYGLGSTLLATSSNTDVGGQFSFTKLATNGASTGTTPIWACPTTGDPIIYITAVGGNTQGTNTTTTNNTASALMAVLGNCSTVASSTVVSLNEISTVASVFAMAQYINPGTSAGSMTMGTSSATGQANTGINNAALSIRNLASITSGQIIPPPAYTGTGAGTGSVVVTATAESAKIVTIANILAACINSAASTSTPCTDLFANALPPVTASATSQPSATFANAVDTIQAAYYMATNPANLGTFTGCSGGSTTTTSCLYNLPTAVAPFGGGLTSAPSDWTIGVTFASTGTCASGGPFITQAYHGAVDASGNLWFVNGSASGTGTTQSFGEMSPLGQPLGCYSATGASAGRGITIDPTGNVWASFNVVTSGTGATAVNGIQELPAGSTTPVGWPAAATPYGIVSDTAGNIYYTSIGNGGFLYKFAAPGASTTPTPSSFVVGPVNGASSTNLPYMATDAQGRVYFDGSTANDIFYAYPQPTANTVNITSFSAAVGTTTTVVTFTTATQSPALVVGQDVVLSGFTSANGTAFNGLHAMVSTATATTFKATLPVAETAVATGTETAATATLESMALGLIVPTAATSYGVAIDSSNNLYAGTTCCNSGAPYRELVQVLAPVAGTTPTVKQTTSNFAGVNGVRGVALDGAANLWAVNEYPGGASATGAAPTATVGQYGVSEAATTGGTAAPFIALSPATAVTSTTCTTTVGCPSGGFLKADFNAPLDLQIDPSGNVWVLNNGTGSATTNGSITAMIGAAVPTVTPLSAAAGANKLATKP